MEESEKPGIEPRVPSLVASALTTELQPPGDHQPSQSSTCRQVPAFLPQHIAYTLMHTHTLSASSPLHISPSPCTLYHLHPSHRCPNSIADSEYGEEGQAAMLCLVCGEMLCTNSYCCQKAVEGMGEGVNATRIGGFTQHTQRSAHSLVPKYSF